MHTQHRVAEIEHVYNNPTKSKSDKIVNKRFYAIQMQLNKFILQCQSQIVYSLIITKKSPI